MFHLGVRNNYGAIFRKGKISRKIFLLSVTKYLGDNFRGRIKSRANILFKGCETFRYNFR